MAQKPWPTQLGSMALLPEHMYSLQASLGNPASSYMYPTPPYIQTTHPGLHGYGHAAVRPAMRVVGAHPHEGWRGAHHVVQRARQLPQPHVGPGGPHALLNEISGQALHRYRACHWENKADPAEVDERCAATLASAQRLTAALLALCDENGSNATLVTDMAASVTQPQEHLPGVSTGSDCSLGTIVKLQVQLDLLRAQITESQAKTKQLSE